MFVAARASTPVLLVVCLLPAVAAAQVDLSPAELRIDSTEPNPTVQVTVSNAASAGSTQPPGLAVRLFDGVPGASNALASVSTTTPLAPGQSEVVTFALGSGFAFNLANGVARALYVRTDPDNLVAETNESNNESFAYRWREGVNPPVPLTHRVLVVTVQGPNYAAHGPQLASTITWAGGTVSHVYLNGNGVVANYLANNGPFDQLWVYDLSHVADNYPLDWDAIAAWYMADPTRDVIADGRMIASLWSNQYLSEGRLIYENYYENLRVRRGGLVLGTDHGGGTSPTNGTGVFVDGINQINDRIGIGRFWGNPGGTYAGMPQVEPNPVRNIPNNLAIFRGGTTYGVLSNSSPGNCPTGFQDASNIAPGRTPLQRTFYTVAWHNGSSGGGAATPAISTTIQGSLGFNVTVNAPCRVPAPGQSNVLALNISTGAVAPLSYQWTSSLDGVVSTGATLDTAILSAGDHTINVTVQDSTGFRPGDSVLVSVGGPDCNASCIPDAEEVAQGLGDTAPTNGILDVCEDADGDGVTDPLDQGPCDPQVQAITYGPAQDVRGMLLYEDLWPGWTDLDFNDAVVAWNTIAQVNTAGQASKLRLTFTVLAVGGDLDNGLGIQLPVAAANVVGVTRSVAGGPAQSLALRAADANATFLLSTNMREFFGHLAGPINSVAGQAFAPVEVVVDVTLAQPVALPGAAPWDVYLFRSNDLAHQIHFPGYGGTAEMNGALFGQTNDGSAPGRWFVDTTGLPYALALPDLAAYPLEGTDIALLYPDIVGFAASGGATNQDFYLTHDNAAFAFRCGPRPPSARCPRPSSTSAASPEARPCAAPPAPYAEGMGTLRRTAVLPLPPSQVFGFLTEPDNARRVLSGVTRFEPLAPGPLRLGSRLLQTRVVMGVAAEAEVEVVAFEPARRLALAGGARGVFVRFEYQLRPAPSGTRVDMTCQVQGQGVMRPFTPLIFSVVEREEGGHLERLAELLGPRPAQSSPSMTSV